MDWITICIAGVIAATVLKVVYLSLALRKTLAEKGVDVGFFGASAQVFGPVTQGAIGGLAAGWLLAEFAEPINVAMGFVTDHLPPLFAHAYVTPAPHVLVDATNRWIEQGGWWEKGISALLTLAVGMLYYARFGSRGHEEERRKLRLLILGGGETAFALALARNALGMLAWVVFPLLVAKSMAFLGLAFATRRWHPVPVSRKITDHRLLLAVYGAVFGVGYLWLLAWIGLGDPNLPVAILVLGMVYGIPLAWISAWFRTWRQGALIGVVIGLAYATGLLLLSGVPSSELLSPGYLPTWLSMLAVTMPGTIVGGVIFAPAAHPA